MAQKTVLKMLLSKFAPLSTEMQDAIVADQSVDDGNERKYIDNDELEAEKATEQEKDEIVAANTPIEAIQKVWPEPKVPKETVREKAKRLYIDKSEDNKEDQELLEGLRGEDGNNPA